MVIRNDRPTTPKPTSTPTPATTGPGDLAGTTRVDDDLDAAGVTDIEKLAGQSLTDGTSLGAPAASATTSTIAAVPRHNPEAVAKIKDPSAVARLINDAAQGMKPGESVSLGGKISGGEGLVGEAGLMVSVTKRADGKLEVKISETVAAGVGGGFDLGKTKAEAKFQLGLTREVNFVVASGEEAAVLMVKFAAAKAAQTNPVAGVLAEKVYEHFTEGQVSERKIAVIGEAELAVKSIADHLDIEIKPGDGVGLVESPPGTWFLELEGSIEGKGEVGSDFTMVDGLRAQRTVKATVRVPIAAPDVDVGTPQGLVRHLEGALTRVGDADVALEWRTDIDKKAVGGAVVATKTVKAKDLPAAVLAKEGWSVRGEATFGPREASEVILAGEVEVTANRTLIQFQATGGDVDEQMKKANAAVVQAAQVKQRTIGGH